jgi:hypothetical protein
LGAGPSDRLEHVFASTSARRLLAAALIAPPSAELLAALGRLDPTQLDAGLQVDLLVAWERAAAWVAACQLPVLALVGDAAYAAAAQAEDGRQSADVPFQAAHAEVGAALRLSPAAAERRLEVARMVSGRLPAVQCALSLGDISYWHAQAIALATEELDDAKARWVAARVLPKARHQTVTDLRRALRREVLAVAPKTAEERHAKAKSERKLDWWDLPDGMAELRLVATAADVKAAFHAADAFAASLPRKDADGTRIPIDARRADAAVALITGASGGAAASRPAAAIQVSTDLATLLGLRDNPGELAGYGPIPASAVRALAADGKWRRLIHEPLTGALLDLGKTSYEPSAALERFIRARDVRCSFPGPGCGQPAHRCELDHTCPYESGAAGRTDRANLGPLCKSHHRLKHETGRGLARDPDTHEATWTSSTAHEYPVPRHDHRITQAPEADVGLPFVPSVNVDHLPEVVDSYLVDPGPDPGDFELTVAEDPCPPDPNWRAEMYYRSPPAPDPGYYGEDPYADNDDAERAA